MQVLQFSFLCLNILGFILILGVCVFSFYLLFLLKILQVQRSLKRQLCLFCLFLLFLFSVSSFSFLLVCFPGLVGFNFVFKILITYYLFVCLLCAWLWVHDMPQPMCGDQRTAGGSGFSPSAMWVPKLSLGCDGWQMPFLSEPSLAAILCICI